MSKWANEAKGEACARFGDGEVIENADHKRVKRRDHANVNKSADADHEIVNEHATWSQGARSLSDNDIAAMHAQHSLELEGLRAELATLRGLVEAFANDNRAPAWAEASGINAGLPRTLTGVPSPQGKKPRAWRKPVTNL